MNRAAEKLSHGVLIWILRGIVVYDGCWFRSPGEYDGNELKKSEERHNDSE